MYFRIIAIFLLLFGVLIIVSCEDAKDDNQKLQHNLYAYDNNIDDIPNYGLPVIEIFTADGIGLTEKNCWHNVCVRINGNEIFANLEDSALVKGRGNSSWKFQKKPFTLKFNERKSVLGMKKHKRWVFLANYFDRTLMRNDLTFHFAQIFDNLEWTPHAQYADVMFNGHYVGNYLVCEQVRIDKNRLDIDEITIKNKGINGISGGYLLCFDKYFDEDNKFHSIYNIPVNIVSPASDNFDESMGDYIKSYVDSIELALLRHEFQILRDSLIDYPSFVDFNIVQAITNNSDFVVPRSVYCYKKRNGKLYAGPLWDFDYGTYNNIKSTSFAKAFWYKELYKDSVFVSMLNKRWKELSSHAEEVAMNRIDSVENYIKCSEMHNHFLFPGSGRKEDRKISFEESVNNLRYNIKERFTFLNTFFNNQKIIKQ